jgi:hypothetical protein
MAAVTQVVVTEVEVDSLVVVAAVEAASLVVAAMAEVEVEGTGN